MEYNDIDKLKDFTIDEVRERIFQLSALKFKEYSPEEEYFKLELYVDISIFKEFKKLIESLNNDLKAFYDNITLSIIFDRVMDINK